MNVLGMVPQINRTNRMSVHPSPIIYHICCLYSYMLSVSIYLYLCLSAEIDFKELAYPLGENGKSKICRVASRLKTQAGFPFLT